MRKTILAIILLTIAAPDNIGAQEPVRIKRTVEAITFDGHPTENAWSFLENFHLVMHRPNFGNEPTEKSDVFIGYDDVYLWVGARLYMNDATKIFTTSKKRDEDIRGFDAFGLVIDTYNDNENALAFFTAPTGLRTDYTISNDASFSGGGPPDAVQNMSWNTFWDVKTTRDDKGWYLEMRIPFSSLKFKPRDNIAEMGLLIVRDISEYNETDTYPAVDPKYGFMATNKPSQAQTIIFEGAKPERPVYLSPFAISGFTREYTPDEGETEYVKSDNPELNAGVDLKYNINSNFTLDLTANTDFAQVEADDQQVNLTRYSLFFPEKRVFFQERSSIFSFGLGGFNDNLFYSRNIGIVDGQPIRIYGGARLTGRVNKWDVGFLDMQTADHDTIPGENFGVLRVRRQVINPNSYVGGMFTSRIGMSGDQNLAYGLDGIFRLFGDDYLSVKWAQSYDSKTGNKLSSINSSFIFANWERRSEEGFAYNLNYTFAGQQFNPGSGFLMRQGIQGYNARLLYGWIPGEKSKLFNYNVNVLSEYYTRLDDGKLESFKIDPGFEINTKSGIHSEVALEFSREGVSRDFRLSDSISIPAGEYSFYTFKGMFISPDTKKVSLMADISAGQFYDGKRFGIRPEINLNLSASIRIAVGYEFNAIRFPERETNNSLDIHSVNTRFSYMFNTKLSASVLLQYVNTEGDLIANFRLRYNPREGNDFYLVYNEYRGLNMQDEITSPPPFFNRTIMVKYTHTFIL